jgi:hypothetical protein
MTWLVARPAAGRPPRVRLQRSDLKASQGRLSGPSGALENLADVQAASLAAWEAFRRCPQCGIDDFTQHPAPK